MQCLSSEDKARCGNDGLLKRVMSVRAGGRVATEEGGRVAAEKGGMEGVGGRG